MINHQWKSSQGVSDNVFKFIQRREVLTYSRAGMCNPKVLSKAASFQDPWILIIYIGSFVRSMISIGFLPLMSKAVWYTTLKSREAEPTQNKTGQIGESPSSGESLSPKTNPSWKLSFISTQPSTAYWLVVKVAASIWSSVATSGSGINLQAASIPGHELHHQTFPQPMLHLAHYFQCDAFST